MMNKKLFFCIAATIFITQIFAQDAPTYQSDEGQKGFKKENVFVGGALNLGFGSNTFQIGAVPEIGYSIAQWLDAGIALNINYYSERADPYFNGNIRFRNFNYGGGPFIRIYPIHFLFLQTQFEANRIKVNQKDFNTGYSYENTYSSSSLIAGLGYTQRIVGQSSFYTMIGIDLLDDINSPYRDYNGSVIPIIRAGFDFYLRPSHRR
jgi:hypothetical protein